MRKVLRERYTEFKASVGKQKEVEGVKELDISSIRKGRQLKEKGEPTFTYKLFDQYPDKPLPLDLIQDIIRFRVAENKEQTAAKQAVKSARTKPKKQ